MIRFHKQTVLVCVVAIASIQNVSYAFIPLNKTFSVLSQGIQHKDVRQKEMLGYRGGGQDDVHLAAKSGRIVEMEVSNLDGEEGKTGIVRILLRDDWAPLGVARFQVSTPWCARISRLNFLNHHSIYKYFSLHRSLWRTDSTIIVVSFVFYRILSPKLV